MSGERVSTLSLFRDADDAKAFAPGETIFVEGDEGRQMFVVLEGTVRLSVTGRTLEKVVKGGVFGEMALIDAAPRSATATALVRLHAGADHRAAVQVAGEGESRFRPRDHAGHGGAPAQHGPPPLRARAGPDLAQDSAPARGRYWHRAAAPGGCGPCA